MAIGINVSDIESIEVKGNSLELQLRFYKAKIVADDQAKLKEFIKGLKQLVEVKQIVTKESDELPEFYKK